MDEAINNQRACGNQPARTSDVPQAAQVLVQVPERAQVPELALAAAQAREPAFAAGALVLAAFDRFALEALLLLLDALGARWCRLA